MVLRSNPLCVECKLAGRVSEATEVDHIVPLRRGGSNDHSNLQALCKSCHSRKTARDMAGRGTSKTHITIVAGCPGSGKTSYVNSRKRWGDLVVDVDALYAALSGLEWYEKPDALLPFVLTARDAVLSRLTKDNEVASAWVITSESDPKKRAELAESIGASKTVILEVDPQECLRRIAADERRMTKAGDWSGIVNRWWQQYRRGSGEEIVTG